LDAVLPWVLASAFVLLTLIVVGAVAWSLAMLRQPRVLVQTGHWREAAIAAERLGASPLRVFASVREEATHARAACLHLEGRLEESLEVIAKARDTPRRGRFADALALLEGAGLVMAGGDADDVRKAVERLEVACASSQSSPEDLLFLALALHAAGDSARAEATFVKAGTSRPSDAPSPKIYEPAFHYLRGLYLVKIGRSDDAAKDLETAAAGKISTIYVERAAALLPPREGARSDDPRSSLAPQVIDE
jgi:tetratricopeptide (TPR) repeat protein